MRVTYKDKKIKVVTKKDNASNGLNIYKSEKNSRLTNNSCMLM